MITYKNRIIVWIDPFDVGREMNFRIKLLNYLDAVEKALNRPALLSKFGQSSKKMEQFMINLSRMKRLVSYILSCYQY